VKIKKFAKEYIAKVLRKLERPSSSSSRRKSGHSIKTRDPRASSSTAADNISRASSSGTPGEKFVDPSPDADAEEASDGEPDGLDDALDADIDALLDASRHSLDNDYEKGDAEHPPPLKRPDLIRSSSFDVDMQDGTTPVTPMDVDSPALTSVSSLPPKPLAAAFAPSSVQQHPLPAKPLSALGAVPVVTLDKPPDSCAKVLPRLAAWFPDKDSDSAGTP
jgi:hypothetical protein